MFPGFWNYKSNQLYQTSYFNINVNYIPLNRYSTISESNSITSSDIEFISSKNQIIDISDIPPERIRNFCIIAHIDHGKSTLADRLLELSGLIDKNAKNTRVLDKLDVEKERGITVKAQSAGIVLKVKGNKWLINLIDTPGHVDFSYEVSRSLAACQGAILLVDACQGIQAQTIANFYLAFEQDLKIIPALNKIDMDHADIEGVSEQLNTAFEFDKSKIIKLSAKTGLGIEELFPIVINDIPAPVADVDKPFRALLFDAWYDTYVGVVCLFAIQSGVLKKGLRIVSGHSKEVYTVADLGIMHPEKCTTTSLHAGQVGYVILNMKTIKDAHIGDTFGNPDTKFEIFPGFKPPKPMVYCGLFPTDPIDYPKLQNAIDQILLTDSSISISRESSLSLGQGYRLGFLGSLHLEVFTERLEGEYGLSVLNTAPSVPYKVITGDGIEHVICKPSEFVELTKSPKSIVLEPMVIGTFITSADCLSVVINLSSERRGEQLDLSYLDENRIMLKYRLPMAEILDNFYSELKSKTSGKVSFDYETADYEKSDVSYIQIRINNNVIDSLTAITHTSNAQRMVSDWTNKVKETIKRQLFEIRIQGLVNGHSKSTQIVKPFRKDVTAKCYGGDITRKMKLLQRQKEGKKALKNLNNGIELPKEAFTSILKR